MSGPVFRDYNWRDLLSRIDADLDKPAVAYQFGNGRVFIDPGAYGGAYIYSHKHVWKFNTGTAQEWDSPDTRVIVGTDSLTFITSRDESRLSISGLDFAGGSDRYVRMRLRRSIPGVWQGRLYYSTVNHGFDAGYYCDIADSGLASGWVVATWDMHQLTAGGVDWRDSTITGLAFALVTGPAQTGTAQAGTGTDLTLAAGASAVDDTYSAMILRLASGAGSVQERTITDYDGATKVATVSPRWSTNMFRWSEQLSDGYWVKTGLNAFGAGSVVDALADPYTGEMTVDLITENTATDVHRVNQTVPFVSSEKITARCIFKSAGRYTLMIDGVDGVVGAGNYAEFNALNKTYLGSGNVVATMTDLGDGVYECTATFTAISTTSSVIAFLMKQGDIGSLSSYTGDGVSGIYLGRMQCEPYEEISEYIGTTASLAIIPDATTVYETGASFEVDWIGIGASSSLNDENLPIA
jgi:hypothetical protein